jgi:hypothetical protein
VVVFCSGKYIHTAHPRHFSIYEMDLGIFSFRVAVLKGTKSNGLIAEK